MKLLLAILLSVLLGAPSNSFANSLPQAKKDSCQTCGCCIKQKDATQTPAPAALPSGVAYQFDLQFVAAKLLRYLQPESDEYFFTRADILSDAYPPSVPLFQRNCLLLI